jgi:hypothetical protein
MTPQEVEAKVVEFKHRDPFVPFLVEFIDGRTLQVATAGLAINGGGVAFLGPDGGFVDFDFDHVRSITEMQGRKGSMTMKEVEDKVVELIYREPFSPFTVEFNDGEMLEVPHSRLAITADGAGFVSQDRGLVDIDFRKVRAIHVGRREAVA